MFEKASKPCWNAQHFIKEYSNDSVPNCYLFLLENLTFNTYCCWKNNWSHECSSWILQINHITCHLIILGSCTSGACKRNREILWCLKGPLQWKYSFIKPQIASFFSDQKSCHFQNSFCLLYATCLRVRVWSVKFF